MIYWNRTRSSFREKWNSYPSCNLTSFGHWLMVWPLDSPEKRLLRNIALNLRPMWCRSKMPCWRKTLLTWMDRRSLSMTLFSSYGLSGSGFTISLQGITLCPFPVLWKSTAVLLQYVPMPSHRAGLCGKNSAVSANYTAPPSRSEISPNWPPPTGIWTNLLP